MNKLFSRAKLQFLPILLFLLLSFFDISTRTLLIGGGVLTLIMVYLGYIDKQVTFSPLHLAVHTFLVIGGIGALLSLTPLLLIYGSFQEATLFFFITVISIVFLWQAKKGFTTIHRVRLLVSSFSFVLLLLISGVVAKILALLLLLVLIHVSALLSFYKKHTKPSFKPVKKISKRKR